MRLGATGLDPVLTCVVVGPRSLVFARQGALQRRHPFRAARCTRLVEVVGARASLSVFRTRRSTAKMSPAALCSQFSCHRAPYGGFESRSVSPRRFPAGAHRALVGDFAPFFPAALAGQSRSPVENAQVPWPVPRTRVELRLGRTSDRGSSARDSVGSATLASRHSQQAFLLAAKRVIEATDAPFHRARDPRAAAPDQNFVERATHHATPP
jgi:hypothetical protein